MLKYIVYVSMIRLALNIDDGHSISKINALLTLFVVMKTVMVSTTKGQKHKIFLYASNGYM